MKPFKNLSISFFYFQFFVSTLIFISLLAYAARFDIKNNCNITIWAAAVPGGGRQINPGGTWSLEVTPPRTSGRIWARTKCSFNGSGVGKCQTGDCGGLFQCQDGGSGAAPRTLAEFSLGQLNWDFYDISLRDGFNVPMVLNSKCSSIDCAGDLNENCPPELKAPGGCKNPCTTFNTPDFCCNTTSAYCRSTYYSKFLMGGCPGAYSFPRDDNQSMYTCPTGSNYNVVFCPLGTL